MTNGRSALGRRLATGVGMLALTGGAAAAHHSYGMFDMGREQTLSGVVSAFEWTNPHAWLRVDVDQGGRTQSWGLETASPGILARTGWTRNALKPGDRVEVLINPLRDGSAGGNLLGVTTADGRRYGSLAYRAKGAAK